MAQHLIQSEIKEFTKREQWRLPLFPFNVEKWVAWLHTHTLFWIWQTALRKSTFKGGKSAREGMFAQGGVGAVVSSRDRYTIYTIHNTACPVNGVYLISLAHVLCARGNVSPISSAALFPLFLDSFFLFFFIYFHLASGQYFGSKRQYYLFRLALHCIILFTIFPLSHSLSLSYRVILFKPPTNPSPLFFLHP